MASDLNLTAGVTEAVTSRHSDAESESALLAARSRLCTVLGRLEDSEQGIEEAQRERAAVLDELRATVKDLAAERFPSLEAFYTAVVQTGREQGLRLASSNYTVRNALNPGATKADGVVQLAARVVLAAPVRTDDGVLA